MSSILRYIYKSLFPEKNVHHHDEPVENYTIYYDIPAIDDCFKCAQLFVGKNSLVLYFYGIKTYKQFVNALEDNICELVS